MQPQYVVSLRNLLDYLADVRQGYRCTGTILLSAGTGLRQYYLLISPPAPALRRCPASILGVPVYCRVFCLAIALCALLTPDAKAQTCLKDSHETVYQLSDVSSPQPETASAKIRDYLCRGGTEANPVALRVTFNRLSEIAAGSLVTRTELPELDAILGKTGLGESSVYNEAVTLFETFGREITSDTEYTYFRTKIETPPAAGGGSATTTVQKPSIKRKARKVKYLFSAENDEEIDVYIAKDDSVAKREDHWPAGYSQFYTCDRNAIRDIGNVIGCTTIWRYITPADFSMIEADTAERDSAMQRRLERESGAKQEDNPEIEQASYKRHFALLRHLSQRGWPRDFLYITASYSGCGESLGFSYQPHQFILDVVTLENLSNSPVRTDLLGSESETQNFRPPSSSKALKDRPPLPLKLLPLTIEPGQKITVPLRMTFVHSGMLWEKSTPSPDIIPFRDQSKYTYEQLQTVMPGTALRMQFTDENNKKHIRIKQRESFQAPAFPAAVEYVYGPEIAVTGLKVSGQKFMLEGTSANFLDLSVGSDKGSCPVLYVREDGEWVNYSKVIENAREARNKATQTVAVPPGTTHFRLAEHEPEVSYLDRISLSVTARDGRRWMLKPAQKELAADDDVYLRIYAYTHADVSFNLPEGLAAADIAHSELEISGYYRRYSAILSQMD
jgi:hypothetical protein